MTLHVPDLTSDVRSQELDLSPGRHVVPVGPRNDSLIYRNFTKRLVDLVAVIATSPVWVPLLALLALFVILGGHLPFYSQERIGRDGKVFRMWKLRTMVHNAEAKLEVYLAANPAAREEWEKNQKLANDPRVTQVGRLLRKTSIDELPQLWNVLRGDMSLVGPRPMMVHQKNDYHGSAYYRLRPGMTGFWQIADRNRVSFSGRVSFDERYDRQLNLATDLRVLLGTIRVVVRGTGC